MTALIDSNVLLDVITEDRNWFEWSSEMLERVADREVVVINPVVYAEISIRFERIEDLEGAVPEAVRRDAIPYEAAFLAGKAFMRYRRRGGRRTVPIPDFFVGAHAAVAGYRLLTRDRSRYATYFPTVELIAP